MLLPQQVHHFARDRVALVGVFDGSAMVQGKVLWNPAAGFGVSIEPGCNGVKAFVVLCAAVLAVWSIWGRCERNRV